MSTLAHPTKSVQPKTSPLTVAEIIERTPVAPASVDPWYLDWKPCPTPPAWLVYGARVRHSLIPGTWRVVREAALYGNGSDLLVRVREQAADGSLFGPVLSWKVGEVAGLVTDEPAPKAEEPADRPLVVAMAISIDHVHYSVAPLAPAPGAPRAYRFRKMDGDEAVYDLDETATGAFCDCPDFVFRREGLDPLGCKHVRAARMMGLFAEAPEPTPDPEREPRLLDMDGTPLETPGEMSARHRSEHLARVRALLDGNPFMPACCPDAEPQPCQRCITAAPPAEVTITRLAEDPDAIEGIDDDHARNLGPDGGPIKPAPESGFPDDPEVLQLIEDGALEQGEGEGPLEHADAEVFRAIAEGRAEIMREFGLVPYTSWVSRENRDDLMADDALLEGWACYRDKAREDGRRARTAAYLEAEDALIAARQPEARTLAEQVDDHARELRAQGSPLGDLLAERAESLAAQIRALDATNVEQFRDRRNAHIDCAMREAEARMAARCGC